MTIETMTLRASGLPYVGPHPFTTADAPGFFGREEVSRRLAELWRGHRVTVLHGPSGSGRTSLIDAGARPLLRSDEVEVLPAGRLSYGSVFPAAALPEHNPYTLALLSSWSPAQPVSRLAGWSVAEFLTRRTHRTDALGRRLPLLAFIDQAEELVTGPQARERARRSFAEELAEALDEHRQLRLLLSIRDGSLPDLGPYERILGGDVARLQLAPLDSDAALDAVRGPLRGMTRSFAPGAAESLVDYLRAGTPVVEPTFAQVVCERLWRSLPPQGGAITAEVVRAHTDGHPALTGYVARALADVAEQYEVPVGRLRSWMQRAFADTGREPSPEVRRMPPPVLRALEDLHLIKSKRSGGGLTYELQHPRLIGPLGRMIETRPSTAGPAERLRAAERALASGEFARAERQAVTAVRLGPASDLRLRAEAESLLGNVAHGRGLRREAETHYQTAASLFEARQDRVAVGRLLAAIGQLRLADGRRTEALEELHAAAERLPTDLTVQAELSRALWELGQTRAAITVLDGVLSAEGDAPEILRTRGEFLADLGDAEAALRDLDRVRRLRPVTRAARALALATLGRFDEAQRELTVALDEAPTSGPVLLYAARVARLRGDDDTAADLARRAEAARNPDLPPRQRRDARRIHAHRPDDPRPPG
ncbi:tetratricopeptide repeat protein [Actinoallomurus sp. CA-150999]|uniref:nSTAND1 domain-containing NTPase n=1 Tax=Actinoallomurus sp. CA-150999 TaxID=3239887 RepID=UPI003D8B1E5C